MNSLRSFIISFVGVVIIAQYAAGDNSTVQYTMTASDLEQRGQLKQLKFYRSNDSIGLDDMELIEDDAPAIGQPEGAKDRSWFEKLYKGIVIRKDLVLDDPRALSGYLVFNGLEMKNNDFPLFISINGNKFVRPPTKQAHPLAKHYFETGYRFDNWFFVEIPVGDLRKGANEFILWSESDSTSWEVMVASEDEFKRGSETRHHHPNRSAKSRDGGKSWDFEKLGWKDMFDGEYSIRLSLDRYVPQGDYVSPVIDLGEEPAAKGIKKLLAISECRIHWDIDTPAGSVADIYTRLSESPVPSDKSWSSWEAVSGKTALLRNPRGRYLQFRVVMKRENPLVTPSLRGLSVRTVVEDKTPQTKMLYRIVDFKNNHVIRPSVDFTHEDFSKLKDYRDRFELDKVVAGARTEFEAQLKLMRWAYEIPIKDLDPYNWNYYDLPKLERNADGSIKLQKDYKGRRRDGHCLYCNLTLIGACLAMGYPARWVNIDTRETYGHEVTEVWSNDFNKWVFLDATRDYYIYDPDTGIPMSLIEISERLGEIMPRSPDWDIPVRWLIPSDSLAYNVRVAYREGDNKFSVADIAQGPALLIFKGQLHMPIRNDFASRPWPVPWRVSSNWGGELFYGYYNEVFPRKREYRLHTDRPQDFNCPLNQSELTLSETDHPGTLRIDMDTLTPCLETFMVRYDSGEWIKIPSSRFEWTLHEGLNTLAVRTRNTAGVMGHESYVRVVMNN